MKFSISETGRNYNSLFKLADNNWVIIMEQKRRSTDGHVLFEPVKVSGGVQASNCDSYDEYVKIKKKTHHIFVWFVVDAELKVVVFFLWVIFEWVIVSNILKKQAWRKEIFICRANSFP